jgi:hypothetical protein
MILPSDPKREVRETVDEVAQLLDFGIGQPAIGAEDLAASNYGQHSTPGPLVVNSR